MSITLVRPTIEMKEAALAYRQEHFDHGEMIISGSELLDKTDSYEEWIVSVENNTSPETVNPDWVVCDTFFALDEQGKIVGIIDFRHTLNDFLSDYGNIGYSVRPSERRKGYATQMLRQVLEVARKNGLKTVDMAVELGNEPSLKTILKNGGVHKRSFDNEGEPAAIFQINL